MSDESNNNHNHMLERVVKLETQTDYIVRKAEDHDQQISQLSKDLVEGLKNQEELLREMVSGIKEQQQEMHNAYERMGAFTKGVLWLGGLGSAAAVFFLKYGDKIKQFFN